MTAKLQLVELFILLNMTQNHIKGKFIKL